jgi:hypothetical protein
MKKKKETKEEEEEVYLVLSLGGSKTWCGDLMKDGTTW